jgi:hypothetical protein
MTTQDRVLLSRLQAHLRSGKSPDAFPGAISRFSQSWGWRIGWRFFVKDRRLPTLCQPRWQVNKDSQATRIAHRGYVARGTLGDPALLFHA